MELLTDGPDGPLAGTLLRPAAGAADVALILPGSGPTDRDGNGGPGLQTDAYRLLADGLCDAGIASLRIDKRGMHGSRAAVADPNAVQLADYAADIAGWVERLAEEIPEASPWLIGHSEGGLVALTALAAGVEAAGLILLATPGRPLGAVLSEQLRDNPANAPILDAALAAIDTLEAGGDVETDALPASIQPLFAREVQGFLKDLFANDPARLIARAQLPCLILQGAEDIQVSIADAERLAAARPDAQMVLLPGVNHVLKEVPAGDRTANLALYTDPSAPVAASVVEAIAEFIRRG